jgi:hypothetical protein
MARTPIKQPSLHESLARACAATVVWWFLFPAIASAQYVPPAGTWEHRTPEELGLDPVQIQAAIEFAQANESSSPRDLLESHYRSFAREPFGEAIGPIKPRGAQTGIIVKDGYIVAEWGEPARVDMTFSVTKSFLSTVVGLASAEGLIGSVNPSSSPRTTDRSRGTSCCDKRATGRGRSGESPTGRTVRPTIRTSGSPASAPRRAAPTSTTTPG